MPKKEPKTARRLFACSAHEIAYAKFKRAAKKGTIPYAMLFGCNLVVIK